MRNFKRFFNDIINVDEDILMKSISSAHMNKEMYNYPYGTNFTIYFTRSKDTSYTDVNMIYESDMFNGPAFWFNYPTKHLNYFTAAANGDQEKIIEIMDFFGIFWCDIILDIIIVFNQNDFFKDYTQSENQIKLF